jgi:hypothetical protein
MLTRGLFGYHSSLGVVGVLTVLLVVANIAQAQKFGLHGVYMEPNGPDAENYSDRAGGYGLHFVLPLPRPVHMFGLVVGLENILMGMDSREIYDSHSCSHVQEYITQRYTRLFIGGELGGHGRGFLRPHIGMNLAVVNYGFSVEIDRYDDESEDFITRNFARDNHWVFGHDITLGLDLRISRKIFVDIGIRYLNTYSVPVQLDQGLTTVHPEYFQIYLAVGGHGDIFESRD